MKKISVILIVAVVAFIVYPYATLWRIGRALEDQNTVVLDTLIDWQKVRDGLKSDVMAELTTQSVLASSGKTKTEASGTMLGLALGGPVVDRMLEGFATTNFLLKAYRNSWATVASNQMDWVKTATFIAPSSFQVILENPADQTKKAEFFMRFEGLEWRVTKVTPPQGFMDAIRNSN